MSEITDLTGVLAALDISITSKYVLLLLFILFFAVFIRAIRDIIEGLSKPALYFKNKLYNIETKQFIRFRSSFVINLKNDIIRLNDIANWSDFYYTNLEAEVDVDSAVDLVSQPKNRLDMSLQKIFYAFNFLKSLIGLSGKNKIEKNLINAILKSKSHSFLIIGDPGSGKTVSLRHLFLKLADKAISSKDKDAVVPIYLNLKHLNLEPGLLSDEKIREWIIDELREGKARGIYDFIDMNFERMLRNGNFFFFFDSFDEIPSVLDEQEDQDIVQAYAKVLDGFIHSYRCKGLVSSRPYRSPKIFVGQRMTIRPLTNKRIKEALSNFFIQQPMLAEESWQQLSVSRIDLLHFASNPFYLGLLAGYIKINKKLPDRHYDLFKNFVDNRTRTDETRLEQFGSSPSKLIEDASLLAFAMTKAKNIGLEADVDKILVAINDIVQENKWDYVKLDSLLNALSFSMFGKLSDKEIGNSRVFTFVHRRFQEYFSARFVQEHHGSIPIDYLVADNRWREMLVLLCEVLDIEDLQSIFEFIRANLSKGISANSGSIEHKKALEIIRFLRDGFRSRLDIVPEDIRKYCSDFIQNQLLHGTRLDQKRAIESISMADDNSTHMLFEETFKQKSDWLWETAIRSCRTLRSISKPISKSILGFLYYDYITLDYHDYHLYSFLFSPTVLKPFRTYLRMLLLFSVLQLFIYISIIFNKILFDMRSALIMIAVILIVFTLMLLSNLVAKKDWHLNINIRLLIWNPWNYLAISFAYYYFVFQHSDYFAAFFLLVLIFNIFLFLSIFAYPFSFKGLRSLPSEIMRLVDLNRNGPIVVGLIAFYGALVYLLIRILDYLYGFVSNAINLLISNNYSITNIYYSYGAVQAIEVLIIAVLVVLFGIVIAIGISMILFDGTKFFVYNILDQLKLRRLNLLSKSRPKTTIEAIQILNDLGSDFGKIQYLRTLHNWIQDGDRDLFEEEAKEHDGIICDEIYKVIEFWDDSNK